MRTDWFATSNNGNPTPPDAGPHRRAVLSHLGTWRPFPGVLEAIEYARVNKLIGTTIRVVGKTESCARIDAFDASHLFRLDGAIPQGRPEEALVA